jgi:hypothetical protein
VKDPNIEDYLDEQWKGLDGKKTIFQEAKEIFPAAKKKGKTLREVYDRLVEIKGHDDDSWRD